MSLPSCPLFFFPLIFSIFPLALNQPDSSPETIIPWRLTFPLAISSVLSEVVETYFWLEPLRVYGPDCPILFSWQPFFLKNCDLFLGHPPQPLATPFFRLVPGPQWDNTTRWGANFPGDNLQHSRKPPISIHTHSCWATSNPLRIIRSSSAKAPFLKLIFNNFSPFDGYLFFFQKWNGNSLGSSSPPLHSNGDQFVFNCFPWKMMHLSLNTSSYLGI